MCICHTFEATCRKMGDSSIERFTVYDMLVEGARKQQSENRLGQRPPPKSFANTQKRKRGRPGKENTKGNCQPC